MRRNRGPNGFGSNDMRVLLSPTQDVLRFSFPNVQKQLDLPRQTVSKGGLEASGNIDGEVFSLCDCVWKATKEAGEQWELAHPAWLEISAALMRVGEHF